jgi:hypothetical protein
VALLQFGVAALFSRAYWELISTGAVSPLLGLLTFVASALLYIGAARFAASGLKGKRSLLLAGAGLAWSAYAWHLPHIGALPFALGGLVGFVGAWLAMRNQGSVANAVVG